MNRPRVSVLEFEEGALRVEWAELRVCSIRFLEPGEARDQDPEPLPAPLNRMVKASVEQGAAGGEPPQQAGTDFQQAVWQALLAIPPGKVISYKHLAGRVGRPRAIRAAAAACGANRLPVLVPCHRVVASDGSLHGFAGGLDWKRRLLRNEGVQFSPDGLRVTRESFIFTS